MTHPLIICLSVLVALNLPAAVSNRTAAAGVSETIPDATDPVEKEFKRLMEQDDEAQAEVDKWIRDNNAFAQQGAGTPAAELNQRILKRFATVRQGYDDFIKRHPNHARVRVAYASFLSDIGEEDVAFTHLEKARELDPNDPAIWNNLANYHGHNGPVTKAFEYYEKAIALNSKEPVYYQNFGTTVFLFRKDAMEHYRINEQQVFDKALVLYREAMKLDPNDLPLASDVALTYYGIKPPRNDEALQAWTNAFTLAKTEVERQGIHVHFTRVKTHAGRFAEARAHLNLITLPIYEELKPRLARTLEEKEREASGTNAPPPAIESK